MDGCLPFPVAFLSTSFLGTKFGKSQVDPNLAYCFVFKNFFKDETLLLSIRESWNHCSNPPFDYLPTRLLPEVESQEKLEKEGIICVVLPIKTTHLCTLLRILNSFAFTHPFAQIPQGKEMQKSKMVV